MTQASKDTNEETAPPHLWWRPPVRRTPGDRFCPYALGDWLAAAQRAGVPAVPGREISVFETADLKNAEWDGPHQAPGGGWTAERAPEAGHGPEVPRSS